MPAAQIFIGPGGRRMYWASCATGKQQRPVSTVHGLLPATAAKASVAAFEEDGTTPRASGISMHTTGSKKSKVRERQKLRRLNYQTRTLVEQKPHPMYARKQPGSVRKPHAKPGLNVGVNNSSSYCPLTGKIYSWKSKGACPAIIEVDESFEEDSWDAALDGGAEQGDDFEWGEWREVHLTLRDFAVQFREHPPQEVATGGEDEWVCLEQLTEGSAALSDVRTVINGLNLSDRSLSVVGDDASTSSFDSVSLATTTSSEWVQIQVAAC